LHYAHYNFVTFRIMRLYLVFLFGIVLCEAWSQEKRRDWRTLYEQGEAAHNAGNYQAALTFFNQCIQENPAFPDVYFTRGATREQLKDLQGANTDYNIYLELKPDQPEGVLSRGVVRYRLGLHEQAKEDFLKLLTLPPGETNTVYFNTSASTSGSNQIVTAQGAIKPQIFNYLGLVETKLKNYKAAVAWLDSAIRKQPKDADYYVNRGIAKEAMNDEGAIQDYQQAIKLRPDHAIALHNIASWKRKRGEKAEGNDDLEKAIESDSSMLYPYLERGYQRMEGGYYKGALEDYNMALKIFDKDPEIWLNRGHVKEKLNDLKGAYADYSKAIELDEKFGKAWLNRGNVLSKQGRLNEAVEDYSAAITFIPDYAAAFYNRAIAKNRLKQSAEACQDLQKAETLGFTVDEKMKSEICK
jgi:tetratricopeptide (TPR) repeat protein